MLKFENKLIQLFIYKMDSIEIIDQYKAVKKAVDIEKALQGLLEISMGSIKKCSTSVSRCPKFLWALDGPKDASEIKVLGGVYWVSRSSVFDKAKLGRLELSLQPQASQVFARPIKAYYLHPDKPDVVGLPRFYGLSMFGAPTKDIRTLGLPLTTTPDISLRPIQVKAVEASLKQLQEWGGATIIADCGFGKTRLAMGLSTRLGRRVMILCNREVLMLQWASVVQDLCPSWTISWLQGTDSIEKERIKVGPHFFLGIAKASDVCIASIDTLIEGQVPRALLEQFGTVVVDECHHLAAATLVHALPLVPSRYVVGLSATPDRRDGLEHALYWLSGPVSFVYKRLPSITGERDTVEVRKLTVSGGNQVEKIYANGQLAYAEMLTMLSEDLTRNKFIVQNIVDLLDSRRKIIVVSGLVDHCRALRDSVTGLRPDVSTALMAGKHVESALAKSPDTKLVFATYSMLEEGYDDPVLDTLILASPRSRIQQTIGRIERTAEGKLRPLVLDFVDPFSIYPNMWYKRLSFYKSRGFLVQ